MMCHLLDMAKDWRREAIAAGGAEVGGRGWVRCFVASLLARPPLHRPRRYDTA